MVYQSLSLCQFSVFYSFLHCLRFLFSYFLFNNSDLCKIKGFYLNFDRDFIPCTLFNLYSQDFFALFYFFNPFFFISSIYQYQLVLIQMKAIKNNMRRQDNWKKYPYLFNQYKTLVFQCECGKKYESFPGLYLHFQRKHGQKISTKFNPNECRVLKDQDKIVYKYIIQERLSEDEEQKLEETGAGGLEELPRVLQKFLMDSQRFLISQSHFQKQQNPGRRVRKILIDFETYLKEKYSEEMEKVSWKKWVYKIPTYFNIFVEGMQLETGGVEYGQVCAFLFSFSQWLRKQGYSDLILEYIDYSGASNQ